MKAKILALIIGLGMGLVFCSCEKDLEKYSGTDYIRFVSVFEKDSVDYNFGLAGKTTTDRIGIEVKVTGEVLDYDREYKVKVNPVSTVQEGVHFNIPAQNCKLRANRVTDTLWVEVMNTEELKAEKLYLQLDLVESAHFKLCFPESNSCKIYLIGSFGPDGGMSGMKPKDWVVILKRNIVCLSGLAVLLIWKILLIRKRGPLS